MNLTKQETATVLAALRYWQENTFLHADERGHKTITVPSALGGYFEDDDPLALDEIDDLCERMNLGEEPKTFVMMSTYDGNDETPLEATEYTAALSEALEIAGYGVLTSVEIPEHLGE